MTDSLETYDIDAVSDRIGAALLGPESVTDRADSVRSDEEVSPPDTMSANSEPLRPDLLPPPASWKKEMHEHWGKMPREAQAYYNEREQQMLDGMKGFKQISEVIKPYESVFSQSGMSAYQVIDRLLKAHTLLTQGDIASRKQAYDTLGKNLRLVEEAAQAQQANGQPVDPSIKALQDKLSTIEQGLLAQQQAIYDEARSKASQEVDVFAADTKAHPYFDEVAEEMQLFLRQGASLQEAYDKAVWVNAATRAKEQARTLTEHDAKLKENARLQTLPKKKAVAANVRGSGDGQASTEPVGSLEDTIKSTLRDIQQRVS